MKKIYSIFLLFILLVSCSNFPSLSPTNTPQPTSTLTFTPSVTPTITLTPTATPDPNMPPDATGIDQVTGEYTKSVEENGESVVYVWKQFKFSGDSNNGVKGHWFKSWMANGTINLTEYEGDCASSWGGSFALNMHVYAVEGQTFLDNFGYLLHPDRTAEWDKYKDIYGGISCSDISLPNTILKDLLYRYLDLPQSDSFLTRNRTFYDEYLMPINGEVSPEKQEQYTNDRRGLFKALNDGEMKIKIGDEEWIPRNGYEVYWIEESMAVDDPTFEVAIHTYTIKGYYIKLSIEEGKLIAFVAPTKWLRDKFTARRIDEKEGLFKLMILLPLEGAINGNYPFENAGFFTFDHYSGNAGEVWGNIGGHSYKLETPFIDFTFVK